MAFSTTKQIERELSIRRVWNFLLGCASHLRVYSRKPVTAGYLLALYGSRCELSDLVLLHEIEDPHTSVFCFPWIKVTSQKLKYLIGNLETL